MNKLIHFLENNYLNLISGAYRGYCMEPVQKAKYWVAIRSIISGSLASVFLSHQLQNLLS
ncbi:MAG: hypothetical protein QM668_10300 [Agriterribacter sp.]